MVLVGAYLQTKAMPVWITVLLIAVGFVQFIIAMALTMRIEQIAGYYECAKCGHKYIPKYSSMYLAMHFGRTRYMKCPHCGKRSWQKKVIRKD